MSLIRPWGHVDWLLPRVGEGRRWRSLVCASFEPRSSALVEHFARSGVKQDVFLVRVDDPPNQFSLDIKKRTDYYEREIHLVSPTVLAREEISLLALPGEWNRIVKNIIEPDASIIIDISAFPKRAFLFMVKQLLASPKVKDLVVCYTRASGYREGRLTDDAEPPAALPGFSRVAPVSSDPSSIVSVGYMAFNLSELLEGSRGRLLKFLFPFPPGSPAFRRNWNLLHQLVPDVAIQTEIRRIHALDMFAALDWISLCASEANGVIDMIPLGPKPHALAMALAARRVGEGAEILYSQPRAYHPDYSSGVAHVLDGRADIVSYCLRRDYVDYA